jgi:hypothetical protein
MYLAVEVKAESGHRGEFLEGVSVVAGGNGIEFCAVLAVVAETVGHGAWLQSLW